MQSDHTQLRNEFQKFLTGVLKHSKKIQAMQSEVCGLTTMMHETRNVVLPNALHFPHDPHLQPLEWKMILPLINQPL
jgi:hypothetical protein